MPEKDQELRKEANTSILIAEDDPDQLLLLVVTIRNELRKFIDHANTNDEQKQKLRNIQILKVGSIVSLEKAVTTKNDAILAILDCNIPDTKGAVAHDQFIKTNHRITGQHRSVDIVAKYLPGTPITMISSMNRFQRIVIQYYRRTDNLDIDFINKSDSSMLKKNIKQSLKRYLKTAN